MMGGEEFREITKFPARSGVTYIGNSIMAYY